jgi:ankyrin repeat protein
VVNAKSNRGETALMFAAYKGNLEVVKALVDKGAEVNAKDYAGNTALMRASKNEYEDVVQMLKSAGAKE